MKKKSHKKAPQSEAVYRLHISAPPNVASIRVPAPAPAHVSLSPTSSLFRESKIFIFLWDKIQFALVSFVVFIVIYVGLNWQALALNFSHYWDVWRGYESPLNQLVQEQKQAPEKLLINDQTTRATTIIPPLNGEVYPPDMRLIVPRINQNVPVIGVNNDNLIARKWDDLESDIQKALRSGVIHYPGTALPGENGNVVITGHSSYYAWDPGRFKDVFALLHDVRMGDKMVLYFNQKKFVYEVSNIKVVLPKDVDVLGPASSEQLTLITCTPIGTNLKRLIITAKLVAKS